MWRRHSLVKRAKKGDGEAFVQLVQQYESTLYKVASRLLEQEEDIADAMQEAILAAYESIHTLKEDKYFHTWLCKILINKCNAILNKRAKVVLVDEVRSEKADRDAFLRVELEEALHSISHAHRVVLVLYYIVGLNTREISEFLEEAEGTIKSRLSRAKLTLRHEYYREEGRVTNGTSI